jgi:hypothetical protein
MPGHRHGIVAEDRLALVVALLQADALASAQVYRRPDLHRDWELPMVDCRIDSRRIPNMPQTPACSKWHVQK